MSTTPLPVDLVTFTRPGDEGAIRYITTFKRCGLDADWDLASIQDLAAAISAVIGEIYERAAITVTINFNGDAFSEVNASQVPRWAEARGAKLLVFVAAFVEDYVEQHT